MAKKVGVARNNIICLDVETGEFSARENPMTQVALLSFKIDSLEEISRYSSYVKPYDNLIYTIGAEKATGITLKHVNSGISVEETVEMLCQEFTKANTAEIKTKKPALLGHNVLFDIAFIQYAFNKCKVDISKFLDCKEDAFGNYVPLFFDTMILSRLKWGHDETMTSFTLGKCCEKAGVDLFDAHDAFNDVMGTKSLFFYLTNHLRTGKNTSEQSETVRYRKSFQF